MSGFDSHPGLTTEYAWVVKLENTNDLRSFAERLAGSSPAPGTMVNNQKQILLSKISEIIDRYRAKSILDIGAGGSILAVPLSKRVEKYIAIEVVPDRAKELRDVGLAVVERVFPDVAVSGTYDLVLSSHSIPEKKELYRPFLEKAWQLVAPKGHLVIITFKGVKDGLEILASQLRRSWVSSDGEKYDEMIRILSGFGDIDKGKIVSRSNSKDINEMADMLTFSIGGTDQEKESYRQELKNVLETKYKNGDNYIFPHEHLVLIVQKEK